MGQCNHLHLLRHGFESLTHGVELLGAEAARCWHIFQCNLQAGALNIVRAVLDLRHRVESHDVQFDASLGFDGIAWNDNRFLVLHVLDDERQQQLAHLGARLFEVVHQRGQGLCCLLNLRLLLQSTGGSALLPHETGTDARCALDTNARVLQHLVLLLVELKIPRDLVFRPRSCHVVGIKDDVCIHPSTHHAVLRVRHRHSALCPHGAGGSKAPADFGCCGVHIVLQVHHATHPAKRDSGAIFAVPPERHIGEIVMLVRRRAVMQLVRASPVADEHSGHHGLDRLHGACG